MFTPISIMKLHSYPSYMSKILIIFFYWLSMGLQLVKDACLFLMKGLKMYNPQFCFLQTLTQTAVLYQTKDGNGWTVPPEILLSLKRLLFAV